MMKIIIPSARKIGPQERLERQAQALRDNLARRKSQSRARDEPETVETFSTEDSAKNDLSDRN